MKIDSLRSGFLVLMEQLSTFLLGSRSCILGPLPILCWIVVKEEAMLRATTVLRGLLDFCLPLGGIGAALTDKLKLVGKW